MAAETATWLTPSAREICSGVTLSGISAAIPSPPTSSASIAPSSMRRSKSTLPEWSMSILYGTLQRNAGRGRPRVGDVTDYDPR